MCFRQAAHGTWVSFKIQLGFARIAIFRNIVKEQTYVNPEPPILEPMLLNIAKRLNGHIELPNTLQGQLVLRRFDCAGFAPTSGMNILGSMVTFTGAILYSSLKA